MKVLIVEDEHHIAEGLRFNLEAEGFVAEVAVDGDIASSRLASNEFDVIVLDVMMPGKTGFEVASEMRERGDYTPILMLTALGRPEDVLHGFASGADDYLAKPFDLGVLIARVNGLLRRRRWLQSEVKETSADRILTVNGRTIDLVRPGLITAHPPSRRLDEAGS